jgi:muramidase (phage lysozyme)
LIGLPLISINHEVNKFFADKAADASLAYKLLTILSFDEVLLRTYADNQMALAIKNGTLNSLITKLDQILTSESF